MLADDYLNAAVASEEKRLWATSVTLSIGTKTTAAFDAIGTDREYEVISKDYGLPVKETYRDWLLPVSSLVIGGETVSPVRGNVITEGSDEYQIIPIPGKPAVELQEGGYRYLVHSQRVKVSA